MTNSHSRKVLLIHGSSADHWHSIVRERCSDVKIVSSQQFHSGEAPPEQITGLIGWHFPSDLFAQLPKLRWIQFISVGVDEWAGSPDFSNKIVVTNTKGLYADSVADYIMWALLTMTRNFNIVLRNQSKRRWQQISGPSLRGKSIGILGMGNIGRAVAHRAAAFEMKTVGVVSDQATPEQSRVVDNTVPFRDLHKIIGDLDVVAVCMPLTNATRNVLDSKMIGRMKSTAYLINTSRAGIADTQAIAEALNNKRLGGAALDVFEKEPLRRWSNLWKTDNLIVTPHICGITDDYRERVGDLICQNVNRFSSGEPLLNTVDPDKGY